MTRQCILLGLSILATTALAQPIPRVRPIGPVIRSSAEGRFASVTSVRPLRNGRLLVHDLTGRRVVVLDSQLSLVTVVVDTSASPGGYISRLAGLLPFRGDSSLFVDPQTMTMSVINDAGALVRAMAIPRAQDADRLIGGPFGTPGVDSLGRLVYRGVATPDRRNASAGTPEPGQPFAMPQIPDSAPLLRVDLATRQTDTLAFLKVPAMTLQVTETAQGYLTSMRTNPMPLVDDWTLLPDGRVAVLRGRDYHVDWLQRRDQWASTPKVPFSWERLSDAAKQHVIDSVMIEWRKHREDITPIVQGGNSQGDPPRGNARRVGPNIQAVEPKELPDYRPAFKQGSLTADRTGRLWVRTTTPTDAGPIYDVIDGTGKLVDRVKLPLGRVITGFGDGVAYLAALVDGRARLEVARLR